MNNKNLKLLDLFAGAGGFDLVLWLGFVYFG